MYFHEVLEKLLDISDSNGCQYIRECPNLLRNVNWRRENLYFTTEPQAMPEQILNKEGYNE